MFEVEVSGQVQDIFREYCLAFCLALLPADIARGFQAQAPRPVEPVPLGALISALQLLLSEPYPAMMLTPTLTSIPSDATTTLPCHCLIC